MLPVIYNAPQCPNAPVTTGKKKLKLKREKRKNHEWSVGRSVSFDCTVSVISVELNGVGDRTREASLPIDFPHKRVRRQESHRSGQQAVHSASE